MTSPHIRYNFHKTVQDPTHGEFQHQYFKRGRPDLLQLIKRKAGHTSSASAANSSNSASAAGGAASGSGSNSKSTRAGKESAAAAAAAAADGSGGSGGKGKASVSRGLSAGGGGGGGAMTQASPLARAMAEAWPEHKEKIAAHTDTVITELVQLQHWAKHMEHRIVELEAQNRHLNSANDTLWKTLQKHSASQLQMQTKMQKIIYFLYHTVLTPEAKAQLEQLDAEK